MAAKNSAHLFGKFRNWIMSWNQHMLVSVSTNGRCTLSTFAKIGIILITLAWALQASAQPPPTPHWAITYTYNGTSAYTNSAGGNFSLPWNMGGNGSGIGCNAGQSCSVSGSGTITATLRWVNNNSDTTIAPNPPAQIAIVESTRADWTGQIMTVGSDADLSTSGNNDDGDSDIFTQTGSGDVVTGDSSGAHYSLINSSSGNITRSVSMNVQGTVSIASSSTGTGYISPSYSYTIAIVKPHAHPTNFHRTTYQDLGAGDIRFWYAWDSDSGNLSDLNCNMYEKVLYSGDGTNQFINGKLYFCPSNPPFDGWAFPQPTSVNFGPGSGGVMNDTHSKAGAFNVPLQYFMRNWVIRGFRKSPVEHVVDSVVWTDNRTLPT